jgi:hypothetical protein
VRTSRHWFQPRSGQFEQEFFLAVEVAPDGGGVQAGGFGDGCTTQRWLRGRSEADLFDGSQPATALSQQSASTLGTLSHSSSEPKEGHHR